MRVVLAVLAVAVAILYFTFGVRVGAATLTPLYLLNAQGQSSYPFRTYQAGKLTVTGSCQGKGGQATLRLLAPDGTALSAVLCRQGSWSLDMNGSGEAGTYLLNVEYQHYTGRLELNAVY
ncbi:hypothetical protein GCM10022631_00380 [Deinococcus rubellus]|uniref:Uncharacterized protein n=1 Tax=Deinococcus rubellus TaxID=1889240 RepID=A0ABY5YFR2_9DEIO|nr:hypothetical protein [Deinococcus rubellus]UWX63006.1 hypothetical protein N0D28_09540 [Deinococcus rubellus]